MLLLVAGLLSEYKRLINWLAVCCLLLVLGLVAGCSSVCWFRLFNSLLLVVLVILVVVCIAR